MSISHGQLNTAYRDPLLSLKAANAVKYWRRLCVVRCRVEQETSVVVNSKTLYPVGFNSLETALAEHVVLELFSRKLRNNQAAVRCSVYHIQFDYPGLLKRSKPRSLL